MSFETITEKIFKERVSIDTSGMKYVEYGMDYVRFKIGDKLFEVKVKEKFSNQPLKSK
jgi:hypothetical protein